MQAFTQADTMLEAHFGNARAERFQGRAVSGAGHKDDAFPGQVQGFDLRPIPFAGHHKFEPCVGKRCKCGGDILLRGDRIAGVLQFRRNIPLVHPFQQSCAGNDGAVCFHLYKYGGWQQGKQLGNPLLLQQGLAARHHQVGAGVFPHTPCKLTWRQVEAIPPRILGIAPRTTQIAPRKPYENRRGSRAVPFPLQGVKNLRPAFYACNVHVLLV